MKVVFDEITKSFGLIDKVKSAFNTIKLTAKYQNSDTVQIIVNILNSFLYDPEVRQVDCGKLKSSSDYWKLLNFLDNYNEAVNEYDELVLLNTEKNVILNRATLSYHKLTDDEKITLKRYLDYIIR